MRIGRPIPAAWLLLWCGALVPLAAREASGGDDDEAFLAVAAVRLAAPDADTRAAALTRLEALAEQRHEGLDDLAGALGDVLRRRPADEGVRAVRVLARLGGEEARRRWLSALDAEAEPAVFLAALDTAGLRRADVGTLKDLLERVRADDPSEAARALALEALGAVGGPLARPLLVEPRRAPVPGGPEPWLLASARALGLGRLGDRAGVPALLDLLAHPDAAPRVHAWEALVRISGVELPAERAAWEAWWRAGEREGGEPAPSAAPVAGAGARYREEEPPPVYVPHYYRVPIDRRGSRVVFCLDVSQSMYGRGIDGARRELEATLRSLPASYAFGLVAFNERVRPYAPALVPAHPVVKARVLAWVDALETLSYTNLYDAVETAFGMGGIGPRAVAGAPALDAVFLLSDGAPNRGRYRQDDAVVEAIAALSQRRVPVHAIAAGEEVFPLLQRIAAATGGRFVDAFEFD